MPSIKQIGTICFLFLISIFPTFADNEPTLIPSSEPGCNQSVLNTTDGSAALEAIYTPNTIGTTWYSDGVQLTVDNAATSCTYDSAMTLPTNPTKAGYEFNGWRLIVPPFNLTTLDPTIHSTSYEYKAISNSNQYNETSSQTSSGADAAGLNSGEWMATFSYGTIYGRAYCSSLQGGRGDVEDEPYWPSGQSNNWRASNAQVTANPGKTCWCQVTGYTPQNGTRQNVSSTDWIAFYEGKLGMILGLACNHYWDNDHDMDAAYECETEACFKYCPYFCAWETMDTSSTGGYRNTYLPALYGISQ